MKTAREVAAEIALGAILEPDEYERAWKTMDTALGLEVSDLGFTVDEVIAHYGSGSRDSMMHRLNRLVVAGKLVKGWRRPPNGCKVRVYRPVE